MCGGDGLRNLLEAPWPSDAPTPTAALLAELCDYHGVWLTRATLPGNTVALRDHQRLWLASWLWPGADESREDATERRRRLRVVLAGQLASLDLELPGWVHVYPSAHPHQRTQTGLRVFLRLGTRLWGERPARDARLWFPHELARWGDAPERVCASWLWHWRRAQEEHRAGVWQPLRAVDAPRAALG